jgi:hypothetical protein
MKTLKLALAPLVLVGLIAGCSDDETGSIDAAPGTPDAAPGTPDAAPGTPDAAPGSPDAGTACSSGNFNFFVMSLQAIDYAAGCIDDPLMAEEDLPSDCAGLGGDLGGLSGADKLCQDAADRVGACDKTWVAFLSATDDGTGTGTNVNAIDRVTGNGTFTGPWYDVSGYLLADDVTGLLADRPDGSTTVVWNDGWDDWTFKNCLTTELGNCNHTYGDSHDTITGSNQDGELERDDPTYTCNDWTSTTNNTSCDGTHDTCWPMVGHTWPAGSGSNWIASHRAGGCQANQNLGNDFQVGVGGHGGYGAFYCFGL